MNALSLGLLLVGIAAALPVSAQEKPVPQFTALKEQYDEKVKLEVQQSHDAAIVDLNTKYTAALDRALESAQRAGKLEDAVALRGDKEALALGKGVPATDDEGAPSALKQLRDTYRQAAGRLEAERVKKLQPLQAAFAKALDGLVTTLTKEGKLDEAMMVKRRRDELAAAVPAPAPTTLGVPSTAITPVGRATKESPFANSLGMKFVPVPGTSVLMCIHETRRRDYAAYAAEVTGIDDTWANARWENLPVGHEDDHPVTGVSWEDAQKFCEWLSKKEGRTYRLPTDEEWSTAVGLGRAEKRPKGTTPEMLAAKETTQFPWGDDFPPKTKDQAGNYGDTAWHEKSPSQSWIQDYTDGFATTAPVMSFKPNKLGLHDMGGNLWEWVDDWFNAAQAERGLRGGSFFNFDRLALLSSARSRAAPTVRNGNRGFRCVVAP
jgi:formylglycine-generating enzyme required for sulfatase activity